MRAPSQAAIERLRSQLRGAVLCQPDSGYEETRRVWNGMIDRQPLLIARCLGLADVVETVRFAREHDLPLTIRGGGHGVSGKAVMDGIVTAFEYQLHSLGPVLGGILLHPGERALGLLRHYRDLTADAPDELTDYAALMTGPDGAPLAAIAFCHSGADRAAAEKDAEKFRAFAPPMADMTGWKPYVEIQGMLDFTAPKALLYYFKCSF